MRTRKSTTILKIRQRVVQFLTERKRKGKMSMSYKDPERKRQWEREHREQRNAARRKQPLPPGSGQYATPKPTRDPISTQQSGDGWKVLASIALGIGVVLLGLALGVPLPDQGQ